MSALLDRGEKPVARSVGVHGLVQKHLVDVPQQEPHRAEGADRGGQEFMGNGDEDRRQRCSGMRSAIAARRCRTRARRRRLTTS